MPLSRWVPFVSNRRLLPATRSWTVLETRYSIGCRTVHDSGAQVDGDSRQVVAALLELADVHAGTGGQADPLHEPEDLDRGEDGTHRPVEDREDAITGRLDEAATVAGHGSAGDVVVRVHRGVPPLISDRLKALGRGDDVGEEHRSQTTVRPLHRFESTDVHEELRGGLEKQLPAVAEGPLVASRDLDRSHVGEVVGDVSGARRNELTRHRRGDDECGVRTSGSTSRTSLWLYISTHRRASTGVANDRSLRAAQSTNCRSSARLGAYSRAVTPVPQTDSVCSMKSRMLSAGTPTS